MRPRRPASSSTSSISGARSSRPPALMLAVRSPPSPAIPTPMNRS
jgi:hypothetical protein